MREVHIIGMGPGDPGLVTCRARDFVARADLLVGSRRLLDALALREDQSMSEAITHDAIARALAKDRAWSCACVLMSGDVGMHSGANSLPEKLRDVLGSDCEVSLECGVSSLCLLAARLERPWHDWVVASAHGVDCDVARIVRSSSPHPVFLLLGCGEDVAATCQILSEAGLGEALVSVGARLSYPDERVVSGTARELAQSAEGYGSPCALLIETPKQATPAWPFRTPGIPDECFERGDVPMTKQEVRCVALAKLAVAQTDVVWDVGAGTGSVSVECALLASQGLVCAIEQSDDACELVASNLQRFGCGNARLVHGRAPEALDGLPAPDAVFVGGTSGDLGPIVDAALRANPACRLCVTCATLETLTQVASVLGDERLEQFEIAQVSVARGRLAGSHHLLQALNPIFVASARGQGDERSALP